MMSSPAAIWPFGILAVIGGVATFVGWAIYREGSPVDGAAGSTTARLERR